MEPGVPVRALSNFLDVPAETVGKIDDRQPPGLPSDRWRFSIEWFPPDRSKRKGGRVWSFGLTLDDLPRLELIDETEFRRVLYGAAPNENHPETTLPASPQTVLPFDAPESIE